ncbi:MAG: hypothetical protein CMJ81_11565 [Planctomycetaceae bacterium]|jgi:hypothetical protein|nr:hypothetical protein [Planctomycetaceae bacterium]MBP60813.1 hypothetical protein [Planctomycetaceae bacterium]
MGSNGLGPFGWAAIQTQRSGPALYHIIPGEGNASMVSGFIVALAFRFVTILVAAFGAIVYWTSRREVKELMSQP